MTTARSKMLELLSQRDKLRSEYNAKYSELHKIEDTARQTIKSIIEEENLLAQNSDWDAEDRDVLHSSLFLVARTPTSDLISAFGDYRCYAIDLDAGVSISNDPDGRVSLYMDSFRRALPFIKKHKLSVRFHGLDKRLRTANENVLALKSLMDLSNRKEKDQ